MPECAGPGGDDPFDPWDLDDVRERVVLPVVSSLIRPPDVRRIDVGWGPREPMPGFWSDDELWVLVDAAGSVWQSQIWQLELADQLQSLGEVARELADRLEDWVCEQVYWGEQAIARFVIPARRS
jgi:hypothetical protein